MYAVIWNQIKNAKLLIEKHANVNVFDSSGETRLMLAASHGYLSMARLLVDEVADEMQKTIPA
jgi:ankyrin repeat protein